MIVLANRGLCADRLWKAIRQVSIGLILAGSLTVLGQALARLEQPGEAEAAYQEALEICRKSGLHGLVMEPLAGYACLSLQQGKTTSALAFVEEVLHYLETGIGGGFLEPVQWTYLICYQVLTAVGDPRAPAVLEEAYSLIQEWSSRIDDDGLRRSFLENVIVNREIAAAWRQEQRHQTKRRDPKE